jgi:hypothetical protein
MNSKGLRRMQLWADVLFLHSSGRTEEKHGKPHHKINHKRKNNSNDIT